MARGWCQKHYARWRIHGSATVRLPSDVLNGRRVCVRCQQDKLLEDFAANRATCKDCLRAQGREKHAANRAARNEASRLWREENPELAKKLKRDWYHRNKERSQATSLAWREANPERAKASRKDWRAAHPDYGREWSRANKGRRNEYTRRWREAHPELVTEQIRARRAAIREGSLDQETLDRMWTGVCGICDELMDRDLLWPDPLSKSVDHIIPLARGGIHSLTNCQWAHLICNMRKGARVA